MENDVRPKEISEEAKRLVNEVDVDKIADEYLSKKADQEAAARAFVEYVLGYEVGNDEIKDMRNEGLKAFRNVAKGVIKELGVHGAMKDGKLLPFTDSDGKCSLGLFKMVGMDFETRFVEPGKGVEGIINVDTGGRDVELDGRTLYIDHHAKTSRSDSSATERVYDVLVRSGLLEPTMALEGMVSFVTGMDNANFKGMYDKEAFLNSDKNMVGLSRYLGFDELYSFFYDLSNDPLVPMSEVMLSKWPVGEGITKLSEHSIKIRESIDKSVLGLEELEKRGMAFESPRYGKVMVDIGFTMPLGRPCAFAHGYDTFVSYSPEQNSFMVSSRQPLEVDYKDGFIVRGLMWLKPRGGEKLRVNLEEILEQLEVGENGYGEGLKKYFLEEKENSKIGVIDDERVGFIRDKVRKVREDHEMAHQNYKKEVRKRQLEKIREIREK